MPFRALKEHAGLRLDAFLVARLHRYSRASVQKLIAQFVVAIFASAVLTERVVTFTVGQVVAPLPVMGTFEVTDGRINAWRDYFDMNQFTSRMG